MDTQSEPVAVVIRRIPRKGREAAFEAWLQDLSDTARNFPGYLGMDVIKPAAGQADYKLVFRFASSKNLDNFDNSAERRQLLERLEPLVAAELGRHRLSGLDYWFVLPGQHTSPPRYKMVILLFGALYPMSFGLGWAARRFLPGVHWYITLAGSLLITLALMTYVVMPKLTKLLSGWLHKGAIISADE